MPLMISLPLSRPSSAVHPLLGEAEPVGAHADPQRRVGEDGRSSTRRCGSSPCSAATTSRALSNTWSSSHDGYAACSTSQTALCSRMNSVCSSSRPTHQPSSPPELPSSAGSTSIRPSAPIATLPGLEPVADRPLELGRAAVDLRGVPPVRLGVDERPRRTRAARRVRVARRCAAAGSGRRARCRPAGGAPRTAGAGRVPWLNQSRVWNCSHARRDHVQRRRRDHLRPAGQQRRAHQTRVRRHQPVAGSGSVNAQRHVAAEPGAGHAHRRATTGRCRTPSTVRATSARGSGSGSSLRRRCRRRSVS